MTTEINTEAAQVDPLDAFVQGPIDQGTEEKPTENQTTDSATVDNAPEEKPEVDGFQKRIDKVTADKYTEKRRADDLQKQLDKHLAEQAKVTLKKPSLGDPDIDYDEDALEKANRDYEIKQGVQDVLTKQSADAKAEQQRLDGEKALTSFNERITTLGKADFEDKANAVPNLPVGVADALMQSEDGAAMIYHLGSNLEQAEALASMTPAMAIMELGKLSVQLSAKPSIKTSAAPDPIEPLGSGGTVTAKDDNEMSMTEFMAKYG